MLNRFKRWLLVGLITATAPPGNAEQFHALARFDQTGSSVSDTGAQVAATLRLSQAVPFRVFALSDPMRMVLDFQEVDWSAFQADTLNRSATIIDVRAGKFRAGWSRLVFDLARPMEVLSIEMRPDAAGGGAALQMRLGPVSDAQFAARTGAPDNDIWALPVPATTEPLQQRQQGDRQLVVVLDPGHGGIDPGAEVDQLREADLMLIFARELKDTLLRTGRYQVVLTRDEDVFVPLPTRVSIARAARADLFISLHADVVARGRATGATVYTLSSEASDEASALLAERQNRADILAGIDLSAQDDVIADVLMDLARTETHPRAERLADAVVSGIAASVDRLYKTPRMSAGFSVLKAPDIPSILLELGYLSDPRDAKNIADPLWRAIFADGIYLAIEEWAIEDAAEAAFLRK